MRKYITFILFLTFLIGYVAAQNNIDPNKLAPMQQILNASISVTNPIKKASDAQNYMQLIPQFSMFALSQIDSFDMYYHKADTIFYKVYAQNETHKGECELKLYFLNGRKTLAFNPLVQKKKRPTTDIDFNQFNYKLVTKSITKADPINKSHKAIWTRYILQKQYQKTVQTQPQPTTTVDKNNQPFIFQFNQSHN